MRLTAHKDCGTIQAVLKRPNAVCSRNRRASKTLRRQHKVRAQGNNGSQQSVEEEEARLEELERGRRRKVPGTKVKQKQPAASSAEGGSRFAEWKEGELFPKGWEAMPPTQKAAELWMGKRGAMFWANKAAWASVFIIGGAWVLFRVVGPALGLYTLQNDLLSPPNL